MAFIQYAMQVLFSVIYVAMMFINIPRAIVSAKRISEVLDIDPSIKDDGTITYELHTDLVPILNMNQYQVVPEELDYEREDVNEIMIEFGSPIIEEEIKSVFPSATITFGKMDNPSYYRAFSNK